MKLLPKAKDKDIVTQDLEGEVMIYNLITDKMYCLNKTSAIVFQACNGETSFDELKQKYRYTDELIHLALDELKVNDLLDDDFDSPFDGMNRREVIRKVGLATMLALPVIVGITAPVAAAAASVATACPAGFIGYGCVNTPADCTAAACSPNSPVGTLVGAGPCSSNPPGTAQVNCCCG